MRRILPHSRVLLCTEASAETQFITEITELSKSYFSINGLNCGWLPEVLNHYPLERTTVQDSFR